MIEARLTMLILMAASASPCFGMDVTAAVVVPGPAGPGGVAGVGASQTMGLTPGGGMGMSAPQINLNTQPSIRGVYTPQLQLSQPGGLSQPAGGQPALAQPAPGMGLSSVLPSASQSPAAARTEPAARTTPASARSDAAGVQSAAVTPASLDGGAAAPRKLTPEGGPSRIGGPAVDPRTQGGERPTGGALGAMGDIDKARKQGIKGGSDANVAGKLDALFDFSASRNGGMLESMSKGSSGMREMTEASGLPDPKVVGVDQAVSKVRGLAASANETDAPFLYQSAVGMARSGSPGAKAEGLVGRILKDAWRRAPSAVKVVGQGALDAAAQGRTTEALRYTKAVHAWNSLLSSQKDSFIVNLPEFRDAVKHVLSQALSSKASALPAPKVDFRALESGERAPRKALLAFPEGMAGQVAPVPARLAEALALDQAFVAWETQAAVETLGLSAEFGLTPQGGLRDFYRARRAAGDSVFKSFWMAARQFMGAAAAGFWQRLKAFLFTVLRFFGLVPGAAPQGLAVEPGPDVLRDLRGLPGQRLELPPGLPADKDGVGLGYRLHRVAP